MRKKEHGSRAALAGVMLVVGALAGGPASAVEKGPQEDLPRYAAGVGAVALDVVVTDRRGRLVTGLERRDFRVLEAGVPQELSFFEADRTPVTVMVLLDSSASVRSHLRAVQKAATRFVEKLARADRARVGFFHERVNLGRGFTSDKREHAATIKQMRPQRSTHLYDAVIQGLAALDPVPDRKAMLVFSDGADEGSRSAIGDVLEAARRSDASIYAVGLLGWSARAGMHTERSILEDISRVTGGRAFFPADEDDMKDAFDRIRSELQRQYRMGYVPGDAAGEGEAWREIRVELTRRTGLSVRSRLGYYKTSSEAP